MKALTPPYLNTNPASGQKCPNGHTLQTDHVTGRSTCPCQLQTTLPAYLSRVPGLPETMYGHGAGPLSLLGRHMGTGSLYHGSADDRFPGGLKSAPPSGHLPYHYEHLLAAHPYAAAMYPGFDINGMKRKNATRESTSALKAWLFQHRKNPYPTKAEKVMLAIVSQMTLTQVSTWFANARRRLKKENKMEESDIDLDDIEADERSTSSRQSDYDGEVSDHVLDASKQSSDTSDNSDTDEQTTSNKNPAKTYANPAKTYDPAKDCVQRLFSPDSRTEQYLDHLHSPETTYATKYVTSGSMPMLPIPENLKLLRHFDHPTREIDNSADKTKDVNGDSKDESKYNSSKVTEDKINHSTKDNNTSKDKSSSNNAQAPAKKIWSIANIIG